MGDTPTTTKGRLSIPSRNIVREFMFNPPEINDDKQINYGILEIPGASHPVYQFGSGGERAITFDLYLDGDRGKMARMTGEELDASGGISIQNDILFYQSLVYPAGKDSFDMRQVFPYVMFFTFGPMWQQVPVVIKGRLPVQVTYFTPKLEPVRATIKMTLSHIVDRTMTFDEVMPDQFKNGVT